MGVIITGTSHGIGRACALKFIASGFVVFGIDKDEATIDDESKYVHIQADVRDKESLPEIHGVQHIINNAGIVTPKAEAIDVNLIGYINILEKYGESKELKSIVQIGSTASEKGYDNIQYCASQGGRDALTKWAANNYGHDNRHVLVNSINVDGIVPAQPGSEDGTSLEPELYADAALMNTIKELSITKRLATVSEIAEWVYFVAVVNKIMTGQKILLDGELMNCFKFVPYKGWND